MKKLLVVVDMQNDFIDGALGTDEAVKIVPNAVEKIKNWNGDIVYTLDTHNENYLETSEGRALPIAHCIRDTDGWKLNDDIGKAILNTENYIPYFTKKTFGSIDLYNYLRDTEYDRIEFIGLCTDICVISNVLLIKACLPEVNIVVDASCCAGVTPESHKAALTTMKMCQIEVIGE